MSLSTHSESISKKPLVFLVFLEDLKRDVVPVTLLLTLNWSGLGKEQKEQSDNQSWPILQFFVNFTQWTAISVNYQQYE